MIPQSEASPRWRFFGLRNFFSRSSSSNPLNPSGTTMTAKASRMLTYVVSICAIPALLLALSHPDHAAEFAGADGTHDRVESTELHADENADFGAVRNGRGFKDADRFAARLKNRAPKLQHVGCFDGRRNHCFVVLRGCRGNRIR